MTTEELILRLAQCIKREERHEYYERTVLLSDKYRKIVTGEDMDSLMIQFAPRETKEMFDQRKRITKHITKTVAQNVMDIFYKIPRSNSVQRNISYSDNNNDKLKAFNEKLSVFWGDFSLDDYMNERWFELNFVDPNSFIVIEWGYFDNTKERATPYPFEVYSSQAIMYEYVNNDLQYLIARTYETYWEFNKQSGKDEQKQKNIYTIYGDNQTVKFTQLTDKAEIRTILREYRKDPQQYGITGDYFVEDVRTEMVYMITAFTPHNLGYVPAQRVGVKRDLYTDGLTFVSPLDKAMPIFEKMVKANSEFDLTMALHCFPQKIQYAPRCKNRDCRDGTLADGSICGHCHGTGFETITTAQEIITISLPKAREDMIDLTNMMVTLSPPIDLLTFQEQYVIDKLTNLVKESIFNTELYSKKQVAETATGKNISLQNIYDSLYAVAISYSKQWKFFVTTVADVVELSKNLVAFYHFSKDFKMKSLSDLYLDLKMVGDAKASEFVKDEIESDIARVIYSEDERALMKYNVKRSFFPFSGKSPEEIKLIMASPHLATNFTRTFYSNYGQIFDLLEMEQAALQVDFYYLPRDVQWTLIEAKVGEMQKQIDKEVQEATPNINIDMNEPAA